MPPPNVLWRTIGNEAIIRLDGDLDLDFETRFGGVPATIGAGGPYTAVLVATATVSFLDCCGLRWLERLVACVDPAPVHLLDPPPAVCRVLDLTASTFRKRDPELQP